MKECKKVKKLLSGYIDGELTAKYAFSVAEHLKGCSICKKEFSELLKVKELVRGKIRKSLPPDYLVCRLRDEIVRRKNGEILLPTIGDLSRRLIPVPIVVAIVSVVFLIFSSLQHLDKYSLDEHILSGASTTTDTALGLILGIQ